MPSSSFRSPRAFSLLTALAVVLFTLLPPLGDANLLAKEYLFVSATLLLAFVALIKGQIHVPRAAAWVLPLPAFFALSAVQAHHPPTAWLGFGVLLCALLYLLLAAHVASLEGPLLDRLVDFLLAVGVVASLLGLYQYVDYRRSGVAADMVIPWLLPPTWGGRVSGIFYQPNLFALLLVLCLLATLYRAFHTPCVVSRVFSPRLCWLPVPLFAFVLALTQSRAGLLSFAGVFSLLALAHFRRGARLSLPGRRGFVLFIVVVLCSFAGGRTLLHYPVGGSPQPLLSAVGDRGDVVPEVTRAKSDDMRLVFWTSAALIFLDRPLLGVGLDNYKFLLSPTMVRAHDVLGVVEYEAMGHNALWAHNEFLQLTCEGGIVILLLLIAGGIVYLRSFSRALTSAGERGGARGLYLHLFLLPFLLQSLLSWPLRYPPLLMLFLTFAGILFADGKVFVWQPSRPAKTLFSVLIGLGLVSLLSLFLLETRVGGLRRDIVRSAPFGEIIENFNEIAYNPFVGYRVMNSAMPTLTLRAVREGDPAQGSALIPAAERLAELAGGYWQWYNLALLYNLNGRSAEAHAAVQMAIERNPVAEPAWVLLHRLNVLEVSRVTGRPVESLSPQRKLVRENLDAGNRVERGQ